MKNNLKTLLGYLLEGETVSQRPFMLSLNNLVAHRDSLFDAYEHCVYRNRCSESSGPIVVAEIEDGKYQLIDGYHRLIEHLLDRGGLFPIRAILGGIGSGEYAIAREGDRWLGDATMRYGNLEDLTDKETLEGHANKRKNAKKGDVSNRKKLLLLVHPDIVFEPGNVDFIRRYIDRLRDEMPKFDYVITHKFFSDAAPELIDNIGKNLDLWNKLMDVLEAESDWIKRDYKFSASFKDALPDYLIENEGTQIWLGGGYEKLCVADTKKSLLRSLDDIIKETGASIAGCYAPLIITQRHNPSFGDQPVKEHYSALRECIKMITENEIKQRSHMSKEEIGEFKNILPNEQEISHKPKGFWYDCDGEWSNWVEFNMPEWMGEHEYDVELDHSKMIVIRNFQQLKEFNEKYSIKPEESEDLDNDYLIDWRRVAAEYAGIEICPYISKVQQIRETGKVYEWYSTWDVASGCVWNREAIKSIEKKNKKSLGNDIWYHTTSRKNWEKIREQGLKVGSPPKFSMASLEYMSSIYGRVPLFFSKSPDLYRNLQSGDDLVTLEVDLSGIPKLADIPSLIDHGANIDPDREIIWFEEEETPPSLQQFIDPDREGISFDELGHPGEVSNAVIELTGTCAIIQDINKDKIKIYN